ncbi:MAG TPA: hypothetical protein VJM57_06500 [Thermodesulfobacteriota bacterium]|nr:hypothetical protein [Thermodesulfobacteriota bacterium]
MYISNSLPPRPHLFCLKKTGPRESSFIKIGIRIKRGLKIRMAKKAPAISMMFFRTSLIYSGAEKAFYARMRQLVILHQPDVCALGAGMLARVLS